MSGSDSPFDETSICVGCGLCCDGTLHPFSNLAQGDEAIVLREGLELVEVDGAKAFPQPCAKFACGRCTIYERRPGVCRSYRCQLLIDVDDGRIGLDEARDLIASVKGLLANLPQFAGEALTRDRRKAVWEELKVSSKIDGPDRKRLLKSLLDLASLEFLLDEHFRLRSKKAESRSEGR